MSPPFKTIQNQNLESQFARELDEILSWWVKNMPDKDRGGFYGRVAYGEILHPDADKGIVLNTRILWAFSAAARKTQNPAYRKIADRAWEYIYTHFRDKEKGGMFWMLKANGEVKDPKKQIYAQAFAMYAFSEYYMLTSSSLALSAAVEIFRLIEQHSYDPVQKGYLEAFDRNWQEMEDLRLSEIDANEAKTMNTHLHILEAYTNLFRIYPEPELKLSLRSLILLFIEKFIDPETSHLHLFFDEEWNLKSRQISFGHDIECSWLLHEAAEVLDEKSILEKVIPITVQMAKATLENGLDIDGSVFNEKLDSHIDTNKHWWPQAEAVVGFWNAWQLSGEEKYKLAAINCWNFIQTYIKDTEHGEWFWGRDEHGQLLQEDKAGPWKAPYHNSRMCLEMIRRIG